MAESHKLTFAGCWFLGATPDGVEYGIRFLDNVLLLDHSEAARLHRSLGAFLRGEPRWEAPTPTARHEPPQPATDPIGKPD